MEDRCAKLVSHCKCKDAVNRGPVCKHAAACLLVEHRVMKERMFEESTEPEVVQPLPKKGKWLLSVFGALKKEKRLVEGSDKAVPMLALPAPPINKLNQETQTRTPPRVQRAIAPPVFHYANPRMSMGFLGGASA